MDLRQTMLGSAAVFGMLIVFFLLLVASVSAAFVVRVVNKHAGADNLTSEQCFLLGGQVVTANLLTKGNCPQGQTVVGWVQGASCPCACCK